MCGYDPFRELDYRLDTEYQMFMRDIDDYDEYLNAIQDEKEDAQLRYYERE